MFDNAIDLLSVSFYFIVAIICSQCGYAVGNR